MYSRVCRAGTAEGNIKQTQKNLRETEVKLRGALKDVETLSELNKSLIQNQKVIAAQKEAAVQARTAQEDEVKVRNTVIYRPYDG